MAFKLLGNYFEGIGLLVYRKFVELDIVFDFWGDILQLTWEEHEQLIIDMRKDSGAPRMLEFWEYLYKELKKIQPNQTKPWNYVIIRRNEKTKVN